MERLNIRFGSTLDWRQNRYTRFQIFRFLKLLVQKKGKYKDSQYTFPFQAQGFRSSDSGWVERSFSVFLFHSLSLSLFLSHQASPHSDLRLSLSKSNPSPFQTPSLSSLYLASPFLFELSVPLFSLCFSSVLSAPPHFFIYLHLFCRCCSSFISSLSILLSPKRKIPLSASLVSLWLNDGKQKWDAFIFLGLVSLACLHNSREHLSSSNHIDPIHSVARKVDKDMQTPKARKSSSEVPQKISPRAIASEAPQKISSQAISSEESQKNSPRPVSLEVPQKISAQGVSLEVPQKISPQAVRQLKATGLESDSASSSNQTRTPKNYRSFNVPERRSPRSPVPEKRRPSRVSELESQISQLQEDLKKVKNQLSFSESCQQQAQQHAEEFNKKLVAMSLKQEESRQLLLQSCSKDSHFIELQKISQERDQAWQSEIEAFQKQHTDMSEALASALDEIRQLKVQLEMVADSEANQTKQAESASAELHSLNENLAETLLFAEDMKNQLRDCKESEFQAQALVGETLLQLKTAKRTVETVKSDNTKAIEAYNTIALELDQSRVHINLLEELVNKLKTDTTNAASNDSQNSPSDQIEAELIRVNSEVEHLRSALETAEIRYNEEQFQNTVQIRNAYELAEQIKSTSSQREAELDADIKISKAAIEELKANLMDKETELQGICEENEVLNMRLETTLLGQREHQLEKELKKVKLDAENLMASLIDKETELKTVSEENEMLKLGNKNMEMNKGNSNNEVVAELEAARVAEQEALLKLGYITEEADKSNRKVARVTEQLEAAQVLNSEMKVELRRLKVQSDQWRKAAEAAASMLSTGNNGILVERTGLSDSHYNPLTGKISLPYSEDIDDDFMKKKNGNMLKKIGVLWKKSQK